MCARRFSSFLFSIFFVFCFCFCLLPSCVLRHPRPSPSHTPFSPISHGFPPTSWPVHNGSFGASASSSSLYIHLINVHGSYIRTHKTEYIALRTVQDIYIYTCECVYILYTYIYLYSYIGQKVSKENEGKTLARKLNSIDTQQAFWYRMRMGFTLGVIGVILIWDL